MGLAARGGGVSDWGGGGTEPGVPAPGIFGWAGTGGITVGAMGGPTGVGGPDNGTGIGVGAFVDGRLIRISVLHLVQRTVSV